MYELILGLGLFAACLLNFNRPRSMALVLMTSCVMLFLPMVLPEPDLLGSYWFSLLVAVELTFASLTLLINAPMSGVVATIGFFNAMVHAAGLAAYQHSWPLYGLYEGLIQGGEISQVLALIILSNPLKAALKAVFAIVESKKGSSGGQPRARLQLA